MSLSITAADARIDEPREIPASFDEQHYTESYSSFTPADLMTLCQRVTSSRI
jgi:hypothetical protein